MARLKRQEIDKRTMVESTRWPLDFVHCRPSAGRVSKASENRLPGTGQHTTFGFRIFKTITHAQAIPAKRGRFSYWTRVENLWESALHRGSTFADNVSLFLKLRVQTNFCERMSTSTPEIRGKSLSLAMKVPAPASGWLPSGWWDCMPVHMSHTVTIIILLISLTLLFSCMMHSSS
jgi:hypothetical protein